jgi:hypothetical protein
MIEAVGMIRHRYRFATNQSSLHHRYDRRAA